MLSNHCASLATFDHVRSARVDWLIWFRHCCDNAIVRLPSLGCDIATYVSALGIVEFDMWILGHLSLYIRSQIHTVTSRTDRSSHELGSDDRGIWIIEVGFEIGNPIRMNIAGEDHGVRGFAFLQKFHEA